MRRSILLALWFSTTPSLLLANPLDHWTVRNPSNATATLYGVTYGQGQFVAVGDAAFLHSTDGSNWFSGDFGGVTPDAAYSVAATPAGFIAPGRGGWIHISTNGSNWVRIASPTNVSVLDGVAYGNGTYVIGGDALLTSSDAINWTVQSVSNPPARVFFLNGAFWGCGSHAFMRSTDGVSWTTIFRQGPDSSLFGVTYGKGKYVAVGYSSPEGAMGHPLIIYSTNGVNWSSSGFGVWYAERDIFSVAYGAGHFVAVTRNAVLSSSDGIYWNYRLPYGYHSSVCYGNGTFVVVGPDGFIYQSDPIVNLELSATPPRLSLEGPSGQSCQIQYSEVLATNQTWSPLATVSLTNTPVSINLEMSNSGQRFYRTVLLP